MPNRNFNVGDRVIAIGDLSSRNAWFYGGRGTVLAVYRHARVAFDAGHANSVPASNGGEWWPVSFVDLIPETSPEAPPPPNRQQQFFPGDIVRWDGPFNRELVITCRWADFYEDRYSVRVRESGIVLRAKPESQLTLVSRFTPPPPIDVASVVTRLVTKRKEKASAAI